jgi:hypothetical protein
LAERAPEKREVTGSTPVPATYMTADCSEWSFLRGARRRRAHRNVSSQHFLRRP